MNNQPVPAVIADRLLAECLGRPEAYDALQRLCDEVGGRTSGAESGRRAEEWARGLFTGWGLHDVRFEELPVGVWTRGTLDAAVLEPVRWPLTALAHGNAPAKADVTAALCDLGHGEQADFEAKAEEVRGRIALCDEGVAAGKRWLHRSEKLRLAVEHGAAGLMILSSASGGLPRTGVCHRQESPIPSIGISQEDGERLKRLFASGSTPRVRIAMTNTVGQGIGRNVLADIPGTDPSGEVVIAGAHLDSWDISQGATDNGLGSAIVLEMARSLQALSRRPRRTLRFALWAAEEVGLCGSRRYSEVHADELDRVAALLNFDMTGDPFGYGVPGRLVASTAFADLVRQLAPLGMRQEFSTKAGLHSDHQPFMLAGVPVVGLQATLPGEGGHYYHSVGDTFEKVSLPAFARAAAVGAHTMWLLADAPDRLLPHFSPAEVRKTIDDSDLMDALTAEGYDGPPMHVEG